MLWGCWLEYDDDQMLSEVWNAATEEFSQDWPSTAVHQIQGTRIILSVSSDQKDWGFMQEWILQDAESLKSNLCTCVCLFTFSSSAFAFLIQTNISFKSL